MKREIYALIAIGIILILTTGIYAIIAPNPGHTSDQISVLVRGTRMTLQEAINDRTFINGPQAGHSYTNQIPIPGETADKILITIGSYKMTLQEGIDNNVFVLATTKSYTTTISSGHLASDINVLIGTVTKTLQAAITAGDLSCSPKTCSDLYPTCGSISDQCGGTLNCPCPTYSWVTGAWGACTVTGTISNNNIIQTRTVECKRSDGTVVADSLCSGTKPTTTQPCIFSQRGCTSCPFGYYPSGGSPQYCSKSDGTQSRYGCSSSTVGPTCSTSFYPDNFWTAWSYSSQADPGCMTRKCCPGYQFIICFKWCSYDIKWEMQD